MAQFSALAFYIPAFRCTLTRLPRRPSILHVVAGLGVEQGGPSHTVPSQCLSIADRGFSAGIIFLSRGERLSVEASCLVGQGIEMLPVSSLQAPTALWRAVSRYDIVQIFGLWNPFCHMAARFSSLQQRPLIIMSAGMLEPWSLQVRWFKKRVAYKLYQRRDLMNASLLLAASTQEAVHIRALGLTTSIAVIPDTVDTPEIDVARSPAQDGRRRLLFLSRIHPKKGLMDLVQAIAALKSTLRRGNWIVTIAGPNEEGHLAAVQLEAARLGVADMFEYVGIAEGISKWRLYHSADLFVLPTRSESFGIVVAEALICGIPVLTTRAAPWGGLEHHRCGWWHEVGPVPLGNALLNAFLTPPAELQEMGRRGRAWVLAEFSLGACGTRLIHCYRWLLEGGPRPEFVVDKLEPK